MHTAIARPGAGLPGASLALGLLALALLLPTAAAARLRLVPDYEARASSFMWWRLEAGAVVDSGSCHPGQNTAQQNDMRSTDGTLIRMFAMQFMPRKPGDDSCLAPPEFDASKRYYGALNPDIGYVMAQEHHAGETWVFQIGERVIVSRRGFSPKQGTKVKLHCKPARGKAYDIELGGSLGLWTYSITNGVSDCAMGLGVAGCSELTKEYLNTSGLLLQLPGGRGLIAVKAFKAGDHWSCSVDGKTYSIPATKQSFRNLARAETKDFEVEPRDGAALPDKPVSPPLPPGDDSLFIPDGDHPLPLP